MSTIKKSSLQKLLPVFNAYKYFDQQQQVIKALWIFIGLLMVINIYMFIGWQSVPLHQRLYLPPDLSAGKLLKTESIPKNTIYAFGYQIFTAINTWNDSGEIDYKKNIAQYRNYLSPSFQQNLHEDYKKREASGALSRKRIMSGVSGRGYKPKLVKYLGNGTWRVDMALQIQESVSGSVVKNVIMDYPLLIERVNESIQDNPWDLVVAGFYAPPYRIKTFI